MKSAVRSNSTMKRLVERASIRARLASVVVRPASAWRINEFAARPVSGYGGGSASKR